MTGRVRIPFLNVVDSPETRRLRTVIEAGTEVIVLLSVDTNRWLVEMYDSISFLVVVRIFLTITNVIGAVVSIAALARHASDLRLHRRHDTSDITKIKLIMTMGSIVVLFGCTLRAVCCAIGPVFASNKITYPTHIFLVYSSLVCDMAGTLIAVSLFVRWGAFGQKRSCFMRHFDFLLVIGAIGFAISTFVFASFQAYFFGNIDAIVIVYAMFGLVSFVGGAITFLIAGHRFVKSLKGDPRVVDGIKDPRRARALTKAVRWISASGVSLLIQVLGAGLASGGDILLSPPGNYAVFALLFYGMSLTGLAHSFAFRPMHDDRPNTRASNLLHRLRDQQSPTENCGKAFKMMVAIDTQGSSPEPAKRRPSLIDHVGEP
eukprot:c17004_g1_i1.p1 GENE.c17004_g1_i1~~c17004_g1_i1.p1  ORF type:complete len:375 (+),score=65.69 c17004_g1_i1:492-1616(+)